MDYLNLQLARYSGLFARLRRYVPNQILSLLYYSIIYSQIKYGILSWGTASNSLLKKVEILLNLILRVITNKSIYTPVGMLYKSLKTLKVTDIYNLELGKFMHQLENNKLPHVFLNFFKKINEIHSYETRLIKTSTYFLPRVTKLFGQLQWRTQKFVKGEGFGVENVIALSSPGNGQKLPKLGLHSKIKCFGFKNILQ